MGQFDLNSSNWSSGAGIVDSFNSLVVGIREAHDSDQAAVGAEIGLAAVSATIDVAAVALDPLSKLTAAGLGWLIEHIGFLRKPLDLLAGNPAEIAHIAAQLHEFAANIRNAASGLTAASRNASEQWRGAAADAFTDAMAMHDHRLNVAGKSVDTSGYIITTSMALIAALRSLIRDVITSVLGDIVSTMVVALAAAPFTFGASIVVGLSRCIVSAVTSVAQMLGKVAKVASLSGRTARRIEELMEALGRLARDLGGKHNDLRDITRVKSSDGAGIDRAPPLPNTGLPKRSPRNSPLKKFEVPALKKHEEWLADKGFGADIDKAKFVDNWLKNNHPDAYPYLKTVSDVKSSKNYVGLADKAALTYGREVADVHQQAEQAWQRADEHWQQERADPAHGSNGQT
jgi:hypothetical protein